VAGARTLEEANHYLEDLEEEFLPWWNQHLVTAPANATDAHRPLGPNTTRQLRSAKWRPIRSTTTTAFQWTGCQEGSIESRSVRDYEEARYAWSDDSMAAWLFAFAGAIWSIHLAKRFRSKTAPKTSAPHPQKVEALASVPSVHEQTAGQATPACMESQPDRSHAHHRQTGRLKLKKERRAKAARRSSRSIHPKTAARGLHQSRSAIKNPQNEHLMARFDWGYGALCFGASPVAAVFGSAPGSATPPEHRIHFNPTPQILPSKKDISIWR